MACIFAKDMLETVKSENYVHMTRKFVVYILCLLLIKEAYRKS